MGRKDVHMDQVPNPTRQTQTAVTLFQYLITLSSLNVVIKKLYRLDLLLDFSAIDQQRHLPKTWRQLNQTPLMLPLQQADNH